MSTFMGTVEAYPDSVAARSGGPALRVAMIGLRGIPASHGGVEHAVEALAVELVERGHDVTVYARRSYSQTRAPDHRGVRLRHLPEINTKHLEAASHTLLAVADALARRCFDVIHFHATGPALFATLPRIARIPSVVTIHGLDWRREKWGPFASRVLQLGLRAAATVPERTIVVSRALQDYVEQSFGRTAAHIPNGIDERDFAEVAAVPELSDRPFVLFLGRLVPEKGVHTLLEAFARTDLDARLVVAGPQTHSGTYVEELERLAAADPRVLMLGARYGAEKAWLLRNAAVLVNPSTLEGMPIVLLEAAICQLPMIVSDIPEHLEVVRDGDRLLARSFRAGDSAALACALEDSFAQPDAPGAAAMYEVVGKRYRWDWIAADTEQVYRDAIAQRS